MGGSRIREGRHFKVIRRWVEGMKGTGEDEILLVYQPFGVSFGKEGKGNSAPLTLFFLGGSSHGR